MVVTYGLRTSNFQSFIVLHIYLYHSLWYFLSTDNINFIPFYSGGKKPYRKNNLIAKTRLIGAIRNINYTSLEPSKGLQNNQEVERDMFKDLSHCRINLKPIFIVICCQS